MENLNNFIRTNNLILDIKDKFKCRICSGVLVEAVESRCLCRFCKKCVVEYLNGEEKSCPGCIKKGKEYMINYTIDVRESFFVEEKLKTLKCKCVYSNCDEEIEINRMLEHIQQCVHSYNLCSGDTNTSEELLILRNVNNELNNKIIKISTEMKSKVEKLEEEKKDLNKETVELRKQIVELNNNFDRFKKENKEVTNKLEKCNSELRNKCENITKDNKEMRKKMEENEERMKKTVESLNEEIKSSKEKNEILTKKFESIERRFNQHNYTFTNMSKIKRNIDHFSTSFQLSNYEFRLGIDYCNDGEIFIWNELLASSNDSSNEWPIKKKFIFEVIKNERRVASREFDYGSSRYQNEFEKVTEGCRSMTDSYIKTYDTKSIFEKKKLNLRLTLN